MREASELERKKKFLRKKEERREAGERERERKGKEYFNERGERSVIKKKNIYIYIYIFSFELQCTSKDKCAL